ncbi:MAG: hypothetical protein FWH34_08535 [Desulfovibrionaceae bacterium]|nr:hypothetical protein [Desulfovibrionaceae bacterium]
MKTFAFALLCSLACMACAKQMTTLSDGKPGYAISCDTVRSRCIDEITRLCRGKSPLIVTERAKEIRQDLGWTDVGAVSSKFNSRYWMEARCDQF